MVERGREREKKILVPNSVHVRPGQENSEKNSKKIQKIKKPLSDIISIQDGLTEAKKERKKYLVPNSVHTRPGKENSVKNSKKIQKTKSHLSGIIFSQKGEEIC